MNIKVERSSVEEKACDVLVVPVFEDAKTLSPGLRKINTLMGGFLWTVLEDEEFEAEVGESLMIHTHNKIPAARVLLLGAGKKKEISLESVRRLAGRAILVSRTVYADRIALAFDNLLSVKVKPEQLGQAISEGTQLAAYRFLKYKGKEEKERAEKMRIHDMTIIDANSKQITALQKGVSRGNRFAAATIYVRDQVNEPAVHMKPKVLAKAAEELGKVPGISVKIYNEAAIQKLKMGSFLSVAAGSDEEAYLIHLTYKPKKKGKVKKVVICGKGITFDSGGLSLKPSSSMEHMKTDMGGASVVLGIFSQIKELKPNVEVHGVIPATENMPSGKATRPGDIVTAYNGKTIEILNTDAEGRLVLADALSWAEDTIQPDYLFDFATLTGAAVVALGQEVAAMMSTDPKLGAAYLAASQAAGEPTWELPFVPEYEELVESTVADVSNTSKVHWAGTIMGGIFLHHFVQKTPWVHIDIAGPVWIEKKIVPYNPLGASGFGVRTMLNLLKELK